MSDLEKFLALKSQEGELIEIKVFWELFGLQRPDPETERIALTFMARMEALKKELLRKHKLHLRNQRTKGYTLVPYQIRATVAAKDGQKALLKAVLKEATLHNNISHPEQLPYDERRLRDSRLQTLAHVRALAKVKPLKES